MPTRPDNSPHLLNFRLTWNQTLRKILKREQVLDHIFLHCELLTFVQMTVDIVCVGLLISCAADDSDHTNFGRLDRMVLQNTIKTNTPRWWNEWFLEENSSTISNLISIWMGLKHGQ